MRADPSPRQVNNITNELTAGMLKAMSPGSEPVTIQVLGMSLTCQRDLPESMDNKTVESAEGGFALASAEQMLGGNFSLTGVVDIKVGPHMVVTGGFVDGG